MARPIPIAAFFAPRTGRRILTPSGNTYRGSIPSPKTGRMVAYESLGERGAALVLEAAPEVLDYREQPRAEQWWDGLRWRRYTPDFAVRTTRGFVLLEVKPRRIARRPEIVLRHRLIRESLRARGTPFVVWTERHVARPRRGVAVLLAAARRGGR